MNLDGFVGPSYVSQSPIADCEELIHWFVEQIESPSAPVHSALYPTPGVTELSNQGAGVKQYAPETTAMPPQTLASAISNFEALHKRLCELVGKAHQLAAVVGGPFPMGGNAAKDTPQQDSAVRRLNENANDCHNQVSQIDECLNAMARSLGA